jgi:hypothetical protein
LDYRSRRELDRLLGDLDHDRQQDRQQDRKERIREAGHAFRFESARRDLLKPAVRGLMARLEQHGHATRLIEPRPTKIRVEVVLQGARPVRGILDVELDEAIGDVHFRARREGTTVSERTLALETLNERSVNGALIELLRALTEPPPAAAPARPW